MPAPSSRVPSGSKPGLWSAAVAGTRRTAGSAAETIGTLIAKIARQPSPGMSRETSRPPSTCPATAERPAVAPYSPMARARARPSVAAWIVASTWGTSTAAAAPCSMRAATRNPIVGARPHRPEVTVNAASPQAYSRLRPKASPSRPPRTRPSA